MGKEVAGYHLQVTTTLGGRYRLGEVLGVGGMGQVYAATDERLDRPVAVKVLRDELARDADARKRFEHEARAAARLAHPNVVTVFDTSHDPGTSYLVMERCSGETLRDEMRRGPIADARLREVAHDVASALAAAHAAGVVHRDVKPANVLIASDGRLKVADFGIAKTLDVAGDTTLAQVTVGPGFGTPRTPHPSGSAARPPRRPATCGRSAWCSTRRLRASDRCPAPTARCATCARGSSPRSPISSSTRCSRIPDRGHLTAE